MVAQIERSAHDAPAGQGDSPAAGARDLGDQAVSAEAAEDAADFGARLSGIVETPVQMRRRGQPFTDIPVGKTAYAVTAVHDALE